jgi:hypothetical protein
MSRRVVAALPLALLAVLMNDAPVEGQSATATRLVAEPAGLSMVVGEASGLTIQAVDAAGAIVDVPLRIVGPRGAISVGDGVVTAARAGEFEIVATQVLPEGVSGDPLVLRVPVTVVWPPVQRVAVTAADGRLYVGTRIPHAATALHADGTERPDAEIRWTSSNPSVATVDRFGRVAGIAPGAVTITASAEGARAEVAYSVLPFDGARVEVTGGAAEARTGDVLRFEARVLTPSGAEVAEVPTVWTYAFTPDDSIHAPGAAAIVEDGAFVAEVPGRYDVLALAGDVSGRTTVEVRPRDAVRQVEIMGQGSVSHVHTSDLWVFEGLDGRDYAITGTWSAGGVAYFWDVTDPAATVKVDSIQVDARTVNDVKVSPDGRYAALSREGASDRRNGVVIIDLADPRNPAIASTFDDGLTGGVHNMFATDGHLFALSGGDKYVILDMSDIYAPTYVSEYNHPDSRIHDVWVHDGIAYSSEWGNGVVVVDVGNGRWGGTIENPVFVNNVPYPVGRTHAAFPYVQESTGKVYLFLGDEILSRRGNAFEGYGGNGAFDPETGQGGVQSPTDGYIHIIDFTDPMNPKDVARYHVPEFGTHNLWVEDDMLYVAYYEGGLRMVDVSGELKGNLAEQGREVAVFKAFDPQGYMANQPQAWGPQPHKGHIFLADFNSGLWSIRLSPQTRTVF